MPIIDVLRQHFPTNNSNDICIFAGVSVPSRTTLTKEQQKATLTSQSLNLVLPQNPPYSDYKLHV